MKYLSIAIALIIASAPLISFAESTWAPSGYDSSIYNPATYSSTNINSSAINYVNSQTQIYNQNPTLQQTNLVNQPTGLARQANGNLTYYPLEPLTPFEAATGYGQTGFERYATIAYPVAITIFSVLALVMLVLSFLQLMTSEASASMHEKAVKNIQAATAGLAILLLSFLIVYTINPNFLKFKINLTNAPVASYTNTNTPAITPYQQYQDQQTTNRDAAYTQDQCTQITNKLTSEGVLGTRGERVGSTNEQDRLTQLLSPANKKSLSTDQISQYQSQLAQETQNLRLDLASEAQCAQLYP